MLALVFLACGLKNFVIFLIAGTSLCPYLCPSTLAGETLLSYPLIRYVFGMQFWVEETLQSIPGAVFSDPFKLVTVLLVAPVLEEVIYRGPLFLSRKESSSAAWWAVGVLLAVVFSIGHGRGGLALLPLFVMSMGSLWLIAITQRFWPSIALHFLHNFFFASVTVLQSIWAAD